MIITTRADGTLVSVEDGGIPLGIHITLGILGIGTHGTIPDIIHGITVLIGDGAEDGTPAGMVVGQAAGAGLVVGAEAGTPDLTETMFIMADHLTADTAGITTIDILPDVVLMVEVLIITDMALPIEHLMEDTAQAEEHQTGAIAVIMLDQQDVTVADEVQQPMDDTTLGDVALHQESQV